MNNERVLEEIISKFLLSTCRLRQQLSKLAVQAALRCVLIATENLDEDNDAIPLTTGSVAEFYIEPMLPHIGDIDVMHHQNTELAIPRGHPPPTQLPAEFHNYVKVNEIIDSHLPGYVYLELRYLLTECVDDGKYTAVEYDRHGFASNHCYSHHTQIHGPARLLTYGSQSLSVDSVRCIRCLVWPSQAADWPTRHRNYDWPESTTVDRVVSNGCDVVPVAHRQCRQHEWMGLRQHRLSFSRAEIVLINSWMPVQQIVYHMLRVFMKTERLTDSDNSGAGTLSNYHIKTLMLWACELKSRTWWVGEFNIVRICVPQLLHTLGDWLTDARCQHYFISNCNLIDKSFYMTNVGGQLMSIDATRLSKWFVDNYIRRCSELCPRSISRLFDDVSTTTKLHNAVSSAVVWQLNKARIDSWCGLQFIEYQIPSCIGRLNARSCSCWMTQLAAVDSRLSVYFTAVALLHVAYKSSRNGLNDELMDVLWILVTKRVCSGRYFNTSSSVLSLGKAAKLMKVVANKPLSTMSLIAIELSKAYLYRALRCEDSDSDSIYCLANVYLAVLYYTTGQYQKAIDHCTLVMRSQDHSQCSSHVVQGELLPNIDVDVTNVLGVALVYQHVRVAAFNHQHRTQHVSALTSELFAYYMNTKSLLHTLSCQFTGTASHDEFRRYKDRISNSVELFIGDVLLFVSLSRLLKQKFYHRAVWQQSQQPRINPTKHSTADLVELLQKYAVAHLTTFRQIEARLIAPVATFVTTDFEALYAYKRGDYQQCLRLSTQNVHTLLYAKCINNIPTLPEFIQLLDDDIVSLTALTMILNPERKCFVGCACITQLTLSLYLMNYCQLKLHQSVISLAVTLDYIKFSHIRHPVDRTLDRLVLKMIAHKALTYITTMIK